MTMAKRSPLAEKLQIVRERIAAAAEKAKRHPSEITLIAVTKTAAPEQIREILQLGVADLGESRVQLLSQRTAQVNEFVQRRIAHGEGGVPEKIRWHMIGHLQRNKVKGVLPLVSLVHSVDSLRLAEELDTQAAPPGPEDSFAAAGECIGGDEQVWRRGRRGRPSGGADRLNAQPPTGGPDDHGAA